MYEYEFRLITKFRPDIYARLMEMYPSYRDYRVMYAPPHFRFRDGKFETKQKLDQIAVYYDGVWFKLVESEEKPFNSWSKTTHCKFLDVVVLHQNPFVIETRREITLSSQAKVYVFEKLFNLEKGFVFELELLCKKSRRVTLDAFRDSISQLAEYKTVYQLLNASCFFPYALFQDCRKPVIPTHQVMNNCLVAHKYDGTFGLVYSYANRIVEVWEDNLRRVRPHTSLGDGFVFAAERMREDKIVLLDVYQVRGSRTLFREKILLEFLPNLKPKLPSPYVVQTYCHNVHDLPSLCDETDGLIFHDVQNDVVYKLKRKHTLDLVFENGYFLLPNKKISYNQKKLENGAVYECQIDERSNLVPIRRRWDRFTGNSKKQLEQLFENSGNKDLLLFQEKHIRK